MKNYKLLSAAVSVALASLTQNVAAFTYDFSKPAELKPAVFAAELPANTTGFTIPGFTVMFPTPTTDVSGAAPFFIKVNLLKGTKFTTAPNIVCKGISAGGGADSALLNLNINNGNSLVYQLQLSTPVRAKFTLKSTGFCRFASPTTYAVAAGSVEVQAANATAISMSAVMQYKDGAANKETVYSTQLISFANVLKAAYSASNTKVIVDVSNGSLTFTTAGSLGKSKTTKTMYTAYLGSIGFGNISSSSGLIAAGGRNLTARDAISKVDIVISGPLLSSINSTGRIFLHKSASYASAGVCLSTGSVVAGKRASGNSVSFTIDTLQTLGTALQPAKIHVCLSTKGTIPMEKGQITATIKPVANTNYRVSAPEAVNNNLVLISKNGSTKKALNVPPPGQTDIGLVRINNMTNKSGRVFITGYKTDGTLVGGKVGVGLANPLTEYQAITLTSENIATLLGETWTGRIWLQVESELADIAVQNFVRSPGAQGNLTNLSDSVRKAE